MAKLTLQKDENGRYEINDLDQFEEACYLAFKHAKRIYVRFTQNYFQGFVMKKVDAMGCITEMKDDEKGYIKPPEEDEGSE